MFTIIDITNGKIVFASCSKMAILNFWAYRLGNSGAGFGKGGKLRFDLLNVTGKDQMCCLEEIPGKSILIPDIGTRPAVEYVSKLKPYQVRDGEGRSIDIKTWESEIQQVVEENKRAVSERIKSLQMRSGNLSSVLCKYRMHMDRFDVADPSYRRRPCGLGSKVHTRHVRVSFIRGSLCVMCDDGEDEDVFDLIPSNGIPKVRKRGLSCRNTFSHVEDKLRNRAHSKSWKDQTKQRYQWAKHKHGATKDSIRVPRGKDLDLPEVVEDLDPYEFDGCDPASEDFALPPQSVMEYEEFLYEMSSAGRAG